jgi:5-methylthioadenosine/S-adenosylhomocysteine deaminase
MSRTLLRGGCVLTMSRSNFGEADVLIDGGVIAEIGSRIRARDAEVVDASNSIVLPGFVDAHRHAWESLFRNSGDTDAVHPCTVGRHHKAEDVYAATLIGLHAALDAGITTVVDWCDVATGPDQTDAALQAHADAGVRSVFVHGTPAWDSTAWADGLRRLAAATASPLTTFAAGPADAGSDEAAAGWDLARDLGMRIHAHAGRRADLTGSLADLAQRGSLDGDVTLVHGAHLDGTDLDAVASASASVVITPCSEMACGLGSPPIQPLIDRDIRPGLGVDSERLSPGDLFAQMRAAISVQHAGYFELKLAGKAGLPRLLSTREVIRYATVDGARAAGLGEVTGTLEVGRRADVVVLRSDRPNIHPINDPIGAVVWGMDTSNVEWVFVDGQAVRTPDSSPADLAVARDAAVEAQRRVAVAAGELVEPAEAR